MKREIKKNQRKNKLQLSVGKTLTGKKLSDSIEKDVILTCAMNFLSSEADVEGVGRVSPTGQFHAKLGRRHARQLACCLAEICVL